MSHMLISELSTLLMKIKLSITGIIAIIIAFLVPIIPLILIVGVAILADTILGIYKAKKLGISITSRKMSALISKMVLYQSAVIGFFVIEKYILDDFIIIFTSIPLVLTKLVTLTLLFIEVQSVNEHVKKLYGISLWLKFKELLKRSKEIKDEIGDITKNNGDNISEPPLL